MKEILVVSGKGGTGKTSITAALASYFKDLVLADCDVDASDLHLILTPNVRLTHSFISGHEANIRQEDCIGCMKCYDACRFGAVKKDNKGSVYIDPVECEGCGVCSWICPAEAIDFNECECGKWFVSGTRYGPMVHAKLNPAAENSGKLVSEVRFRAKMEAKESGTEILLIDGPPGIGCPVIASMTGVDYVLIVTEPTLSGAHDMERVVSLAQHFKAEVFICINKYDINPDMAREIEKKAAKKGVPVIGKIPYDKSFTQAQIMRQSVAEYKSGAAKEAVDKLFFALRKVIYKETVNEKTN